MVGLRSGLVSCGSLCSDLAPGQSLQGGRRKVSVALYPSVRAFVCVGW